MKNLASLYYIQLKNNLEIARASRNTGKTPLINYVIDNNKKNLFSSFGKGSTFSNAGNDGTQPASCVDIQNRQSTYSCGCPMYGACQNDVFCGLFCSATLAIRCRSKAPFVHERLKTPNTTPQAVEPDP